ncbi:MAG: copper-binding protein [Gammaproteobacteria bacterium]|nr:copper-binding protein [Gammaproteobacteria bacterium]
MRVAAAIATVVALIAAPHATAQSTDHQAHHVSQASPAADMVDAEVRRVDKDAGKITLKHGELKSLDMGPMTMVFQVKDKAMLDKVKAGDKVRFAAAKIGGQLTVTAIEPGR